MAGDLQPREDVLPRGSRPGALASRSKLRRWRGCAGWPGLSAWASPRYSDELIGAGIGGGGSAPAPRQLLAALRLF